VSSLILSCSPQKKVITVNDVTDDKIIIIGLIESDYSQLKNNKIRGIDLFIDSKQDISDFILSDKYLPNENAKKFQFISKIGKKGDYELYYNYNPSYSPESNNLLTLMDQQRNASANDRRILSEYTLNDGKIINVGKITVNYNGGNTDGGSIKYSYSFDSDDNDTVAMNAFKLSYPEIYNKYKNEVYVFKSEFDECYKYILSHISPEKKSIIMSFIANHPDRLKVIFKDLSQSTKIKYTETIEKCASAQLNEFLKKNY
jgi:hypothetical protein